MGGCQGGRDVGGATMPGCLFIHGLLLPTYLPTAKGHLLCFRCQTESVILPSQSLRAHVRMCHQESPPVGHRTPS